MLSCTPLASSRKAEFMNTFLLTWNPKLTPWKELPENAHRVARGDRVEDWWNIAAYRKAQKGHRVFLIRVRSSLPGIVASGEIVSKEPKPGGPWSKRFHNRGKRYMYFRIKWDVLLDPNDKPFPREMLNDGVLAKGNWSPRQSGITILPDVANALERKWSNFRKRPTMAAPAEDVAESKLPKRLRQEVTRIVRDTAVTADVKSACEYRCQLCRTRLTLAPGKFYAEGHHLKPLGKPHRGPDKVENVICVCPNCHALLDYHAVRIEPEVINKGKHLVSRAFIDYHNSRCR